MEIKWKSTFDRTTLTVFAGPDSDGSYTYHTLVANASTATTSYIWEAGEVNGKSLAYAIHFTVQDGDNCDGDNCADNSVDVRVAEVAATSTTSAKTSTATKTSTSTSTTSGTSISTGNVGSHKQSQNLSVPLGVGLGVGIPVLIALGAIFGVLVFRRRNRQTDELPRGRQPLASGSDSPLPGWNQPYQPAMDEAGLLAPPIAPAPKDGAQYVAYRPSSHSRDGSRQPSFVEQFDYQADPQELHGQDTVHEVAAVERGERFELASAGSRDRLRS